MIQIRRTLEVARYFYQSHIWTRSSFLGKPISLHGYLEVIAKKVRSSPDEIVDDFKLVHSMKLVTLYMDPERGICIKAGENMGKVAQ